MARYNYEASPISKELQQVVCPLTVTQNVIAGRWKVVVLWHISQHRVIRFNELLKIIPGVSKGILTKQLRELEEDRLVHREVYKVVPPKVEYSLTEQGEKFMPVLEAMQLWGGDFIKNNEDKIAST